MNQLSSQSAQANYLNLLSISESTCGTAVWWQGVTSELFLPPAQSCESNFDCRAIDEFAQPLRKKSPVSVAQLHFQSIVLLSLCTVHQ